MSGYAESIGEAYDDLTKALKKYEEADHLLALVSSGAEVSLPRGVRSRDEYCERIISERIDAFEEVGEAVVTLLVEPFLDPQKGEDEQDLPRAVVTAMMDAARLVMSRPLTPGQTHYGYRLVWEDPPTPQMATAPRKSLVEAVGDLVAEHGFSMISVTEIKLAFEEQLQALLERHGIIAGQLNVKDGVITKNTLRH